MNTVTEFQNVYEPGTSSRTLLLLHGTGGTETDLIPLGRTLDPSAPLLGVRGKVLENGMPRFFRRLAEGVFDEKDLIHRTHELADYLEAFKTKHSVEELYAVGYSNGANIAGSLLLLRPGVLTGAALLRPMVPLVPEPLPELKGAPVLVMAGHLDPIVPADNARALGDLLKASGAEVTVRFENAGHGLTEYTVETTKRWLADHAS